MPDSLRRTKGHSDLRRANALGEEDLPLKLPRVGDPLFSGIGPFPPKDAQHRQRKRLTMTLTFTYPQASYGMIPDEPEWSLLRIDNSMWDRDFYPQFDVAKYLAVYRRPGPRPEDGLTKTIWQTFGQLNTPWGIRALRIFHARYLFKPKDAGFKNPHNLAKEWKGERREWFNGVDPGEEERAVKAKYLADKAKRLEAAAAGQTTTEKDITSQTTGVPTEKPENRNDTPRENKAAGHPSQDTAIQKANFDDAPADSTQDENGIDLRSLIAASQLEGEDVLPDVDYSSTSEYATPDEVKAMSDYELGHHITMLKTLCTETQRKLEHLDLLATMECLDPARITARRDKATAYLAFMNMLLEGATIILLKRLEPALLEHFKRCELNRKTQEPEFTIEELEEDLNARELMMQYAETPSNASRPTPGKPSLANEAYVEAVLAKVRNIPGFFSDSDPVSEEKEKNMGYEPNPTPHKPNPANEAFVTAVLTKALKKRGFSSGPGPVNKEKEEKMEDGPNLTTNSAEQEQTVNEHTTEQEHTVKQEDIAIEDTTEGDRMITDHPAHQANGDQEEVEKDTSDETKHTGADEDYNMLSGDDDDPNGSKRSRDSAGSHRGDLKRTKFLEPDESEEEAENETQEETGGDRE
ncbi:hypothetical protein ABW21_db0208956 [Orbilia brochopaga]|nr:hypothetical protein ABW21_db0208956 [Drechslerella brochopaga]